MPANTHSFDVAIRTAKMQNIITALGNGAVLKEYNGTPPLTKDTALAGNTLLATLTFPGVIGVAGNGAIDFTEAGVTQTNTAHVAGTPTFVRFETSAGVVKWQALCNVTGGFTATAVVNGTNVSPNTLTYADANT